MTPQPVPQKRHGALSHFSAVTLRSVSRFCAAAVMGRPPAAAAIAAASSLRNLRRSIAFMVGSLSLNSTLVGAVEHERGGQDMGQGGDHVERAPDDADVVSFYDHNKLAV